jgi:hypothetical protein
VKPSEDYAIRPDFKETLILQNGVSVRHDSTWTENKGAGQFVSGRLLKTINGRQYAIGFQENTADFLASGGAYADNLKVYEEININNKPHFVITSSSPADGKAYDYAYISSCPIKVNEACSLPLKTNFLFVMLRQDVPGAQYPVELDFSRKDDQQVLAEFAEIASTLQY